MKYTVTIKDNESGEILREAECNAIVGGLAINEIESISIGITNCNGAQLVGACQSAREAISSVTSQDPVVKILYTLFERAHLLKERDELKKKMQEKEDTDND